MSRTKFDHLSKDILAKAFWRKLVGQEVKEYLREEEEVLLAAEEIEVYKIK